MTSKTTTTTTMIWNPKFWSFPPLFGGGTTTKTASVMEQLRDHSTTTTAGEKKGSPLTTLTLVGGTVSQVHYHVTALSEALEQNTSLQNLKVCGTFLPSLRCYQHDTSGISVVGDATPRQSLQRLFRALGSRPHLRSVALQGHEDAFPVECVADLLLEASRNNNKINCDGLEEFSCQHVDLVASTPSDWDRLGTALGKCRSLTRVTLTNMSLECNTDPHQNNTVEPSTMDAIVSQLSHCQEVELGLRYRELVVSSAAALRHLLLGSDDGTIASLVQKLILRRRLVVHEDQLSTILQSLSYNSPVEHRSSLKELQIDDIRLLSSDATASLWKELADMLHSNTSLECLELSFSPADIPTTVDATMNVQDVQGLTSALKSNRTLKRLVLRGVNYTENNHTMAREDNAMHQHYQSCWLQLLEHDNYTLEELQVFEQQDNNNREEENELQERIDFFLQLNRQQVAINHNESGSDITPSHSSCGLRMLLRTYNGAVPSHLIVPCLEAAMEIKDLHPLESEPHLHGHSLSSHDSFFQDFSFDGDCYDLPNISGYGDMETFGPSQTKNMHGTGGLFYLLSQQPSIVLTLKEQLEAQQKLQQSRGEENDGMDISVKNPFVKMQSDKINVAENVRGESPRLLLLDDDIVTLW